jgi:hypothetical protein
MRPPPSTPLARRPSQTPPSPRQRSELLRRPSAAKVAEYLNVDRAFVYENADELGARRLGSGPRARLRFPLEEVDSRQGPCSEKFASVAVRQVWAQTSSCCPFEAEKRPCDRSEAGVGAAPARRPLVGCARPHGARCQAGAVQAAWGAQPGPHRRRPGGDRLVRPRSGEVAAIDKWLGKNPGVTADGQPAACLQIYATLLNTTARLHAQVLAVIEAQSLASLLRSTAATAGEPDPDVLGKVTGARNVPSPLPVSNERPI